MPWKEGKLAEVEPNFHVAKAMSSKVANHLKGKNMFNDYTNVFKQQIEDGILEEIPLDSIDVNEHKWVTHRPVIRTGPQITTKVRPVLNASFKRGKKSSLNDAAYPGINVIKLLFTMLLCIRSNAYLMIADIKQAYLQIKLKSEEDRNRFSILWQDEDGKLVAYRYCSLVFGFISSAFILGHVINHHLNKYANDLCTKYLKNNFYVDNLFITGNSFNELKDLYMNCLSRMAEGGFKLRSWVTNLDPLRQVFIEDEMVADHTSIFEKLLGYNYYPSSDTLSICNFTDSIACYLTKRTSLSHFAKVFDPLGLYSPITVRGKALLRSNHETKLDWDVNLPEDLNNSWISFFKDVTNLSNIKFTREVVRDGYGYTILIFSDASKTAYGFCAYAVGEIGEISSKLLFAKAKIAPIKAKSLPTLELMAVVLALKHLKQLISSLTVHINEVYLCIDAQIVITWIMSGLVKTKNIFARNRVKDTNKLINDIEIEHNLKIKVKYVPTELNPSDLLTRGLKTDDFIKNLDFWTNGPLFIREKKIKWPDRDLGCLSQNNKDLLCGVTILEDIPLINIDIFSFLYRLYRVTALVFKYIYCLRKQFKNRAFLLNAAKLYLFKYVQKNFFKDEIEYLNNKEGKCPSLINSLNLFLDDKDILRCKGRIAKCLRINYDVCNPILLPRNSHFTTLIIMFFHKRCKHMGIGSTLSALRDGGFWIPKARAIIKQVVNDCIICRKINARSFRYPKVTDYVSDRVNFITPFRYTGIDFTGNINVKLGESITKMYILVYTCLNIRAIYIDLLPSMSTISVLQSFIKFSNYHAIPEKIYSDNASSFIQSVSLLNEALISDELCEYFSKNNVQHIRIPLYSAWIGAAWERLIKTVKQALYKEIGKHCMDYFQLSSLLSDIQSAINNRPLTYRNTDDNYLEVISPNSFLKSSYYKSLIFDNLDGTQLEIPNRQNILTSLLHREEIFHKFYEHWYKDYLLSLRESGRELHQVEWDNLIKLGDIVLIEVPNKSRPFWPMGKVTELLTGDDERIRTVKLIRGDRTEGIYSISLLYPLELNAYTDQKNDPKINNDVVPLRRSSRKAAALAKTKMKNIAQ